MERRNFLKSLFGGIAGLAAESQAIPVQGKVIEPVGERLAGRYVHFDGDFEVYEMFTCSNFHEPRLVSLESGYSNGEFPFKK